MVRDQIVAVLRKEVLVSSTLFHESVLCSACAAESFGIHPGTLTMASQLLPWAAMPESDMLVNAYAKPMGPHDVHLSSGECHLCSSGLFGGKSFAFVVCVHLCANCGLAAPKTYECTPASASSPTGLGIRRRGWCGPLRSITFEDVFLEDNVNVDHKVGRAASTAFGTVKASIVLCL